jgi:aconitase A
MAGEIYKDSFGAKSQIETGLGTAQYFRLQKLVEDNVTDISKFPFSIKVLLENLAAIRGQA